MENYNGINIAMDAFSAIITVMIGAYLMSRRSKARESRYLLWFCALNLVFILGDLSDWCCNGLAKPWYPAALHIGQFVYYAVIAPLLLLFMRYVTEYLKPHVRTEKDRLWLRRYLRIAEIFAALHLLGALLTPFTGLYYSISPENIYIRGDYVLLASILPLVVYTLLVCMAVQFHKALRPRDIAALLLFALLPLLGQGIQHVFRGVATLNPAITLATLFVFFNMQLERELCYEEHRQELSEARVRIMLSQIQPHFLYNTLSAIRGLCEADPAMAKESINDFSVFLRANMDSLSHEGPIPFEQELRHARSYLNLEQRMYGDALRVEYDIGASGFLLPALSLQPIVENAVQKGLRKKEGGGTVRICSGETDTHFTLSVTDDGVGFDLGVLEESGHIGIQNVKKRLAALCGGTLQIESTPGRGTEVCMYIPKGGRCDAVSRS